MAKKKKQVKSLLPIIIVAGAAIVALVVAFLLPGVTKTVEGQIFGGQTVYTIALTGLIFGNGPDVAQSGNTTLSTVYEGGMSTFALISFIVMLAGILALVASVFVEGKFLDVIGSLLVAVSGVLMLFVLSGGTEVVTDLIGSLQSTKPFIEYFEGYTLAGGPVIYAIIAIIGGAFGIVNNFVKIIK